MLSVAKDWRFHVDLPELVPEGTQFRVPNDIILTALKPDLLIISRSMKIIILIELTCPNDANLESWRKKKRDKYAKLRRWVTRGWNLHILSLEVISRGFVLANSFYELCTGLGVDTTKGKSFRDSLSKTALRCSYVIWIN